MRTRAAAVVLAAVVLGATGCAASAKHASTASSSPGPTKDPSPAAASSSPMLTPTAPARTPLGAGQRAWAAFSQRGLSHDEWWTRLEPLLSDSAKAVYVYDDPRTIPAMTLTGPIRLAAKAPDEPRFTAEVVVPTSKGRFALDLERHTLASPWLLYAITFPPGVE
jgi:ABC-type transport system substrate-binding protein